LKPLSCQWAAGPGPGLVLDSVNEAAWQGACTQ
jgi:hypothetical protein